MYSQDELRLIQTGLDPDLYPNVDWMDVLLRDGAMTYRANLDISGGGSVARYFVSASYVSEGGMYKTDGKLKDYNTNAEDSRNVTSILLILSFIRTSCVSNPI